MAIVGLGNAAKIASEDDIDFPNKNDNKKATEFHNYKLKIFIIVT